MILNNAEVRSLAGMPGSFAVLTAKDGKRKMGQQGGIIDIRPLAKAPAEPALQGRKLLFQSTIATDMRDTAIQTDFPRVAQLASAIAGQRWKDKYDGVIAVDPVTLGYMLNGIGPVQVGEGVLHQPAAVPDCSMGFTWSIPTIRRSRMTSSSTRRAVFSMRPFRGRATVFSVLRALVRGVSQRRLMLWSRHVDEQGRILTTGIANSFQSGQWTPTGRDLCQRQRLGQVDVLPGYGHPVRSELCSDGLVQKLTTTTTLGSNVPASVELLPPSILGFGPLASPILGNLKLGVMIAGPHGRHHRIHEGGRTGGAPGPRSSQRPTRGQGGEGAAARPVFGHRYEDADCGGQPRRPRAAHDARNPAQPRPGGPELVRLGPDLDRRQLISLSDLSTSSGYFLM